MYIDTKQGKEEQTFQRIFRIFHNCSKMAPLNPAYCGTASCCSATLCNSFLESFACFSRSVFCTTCRTKRSLKLSTAKVNAKASSRGSLRGHAIGQCLKKNNRQVHLTGEWFDSYRSRAFVWNVQTYCTCTHYWCWIMREARKEGRKNQKTNKKKVRHKQTKNKQKQENQVFQICFC